VTVEREGEIERKKGYFHELCNNGDRERNRDGNCNDGSGDNDENNDRDDNHNNGDGTRWGKRESMAIVMKSAQLNTINI